MELNLLWTISRREMREAIRNKWLVIYTAGFALLALALSRASLTSAGYAGLGGFGRTAASLVNALLMFVPLLGLSIGANALSGDRERGSLLYLMAQPVSRAEVFFGKALGTGLAVTLALFIGFGTAALAISSSGIAGIGAFLGLIGYALLLELTSLGLGFIISVFSRKASTSMGAALLLWLGLVFIGDLGLVGLTLKSHPTPAGLLGLLVINPLQAFKLGAIYSLRSTLDTFGAVGQYAVYKFGDTLPLLLSGLLVAWVLISFCTAYLIFNRRRDA